MVRKKWWWFVFIVGFLGFLVVQGLLLNLDLNWEREKVVSEDEQFEDRGLPIINIKLDGVSLEEIKSGSKEIKYEGNQLDLYDKSQTFEYDDVEIKGRGNSTWGQPKIPFQVKFSGKVDFLGLGKAKKWVFLANYLDDSYLRNDIAFSLAEMLEIEFNNRGKFVEVYFNDEYEGLYYVVQRIEIAKGSVDLRNDDGVLFEIDTLRQENEDCYRSYFNDCLVLKDTVLPNEEGVEIANEFVNDFRRFEKALERADYEEVSKIIDVDSFVKYFLVNEYTVNPDAYKSSFFLYRNNEGKIVAGPIWDFDYALGNRRWIWGKNENFFSPLGERKNLNMRFMNYFINMPEVEEKIGQIFREKMSGRADELVSIIYENIKDIKTAAELDGAKWEREDFSFEVSQLIEWIKNRYEYFEQEY